MWMIPFVSKMIFLYVAFYVTQNYKNLVDPVFRYSGGESDQMTPYMCMENCMSQQLHQRYDKDMFIGITQGTLCLCGYDYELKLSAGSKKALNLKFVEIDH